MVSEQTGAISVAQNGKLLRHVDSKTLYDILMTYMAGNAYLRVKRANMRKEYLQMMEEIAHVDPPVNAADKTATKKGGAKERTEKNTDPEATETDDALEASGAEECAENNPRSDDSADKDL